MKILIMLPRLDGRRAVRSTSWPLLEVAPARTRATRWGASTARERSGRPRGLDAIAGPAAWSRVLFDRGGAGAGAASRGRGRQGGQRLAGPRAEGPASLAPPSRASAPCRVGVSSTIEAKAPCNNEPQGRRPLPCMRWKGPPSPAAPTVRSLGSRIRRTRHHRPAKPRRAPVDSVPTSPDGAFRGRLASRISHRELRL
jgi:hypothetical protein